MKFTNEQIAKACKAKNADELLSIAKAEGLSITNDEAKKYYMMLNSNEGELADTELENVAGGSCYSSGVWGPYGEKKYLITTVCNVCRGFEMEDTRTGSGCKYCKHSFAANITLYCAIRTEDHDPYK